MTLPSTVRGDLRDSIAKAAREAYNSADPCTPRAQTWAAITEDVLAELHEVLATIARDENDAAPVHRSFPKEILAAVFAKLSLKERARASQTCTSWRDVIVGTPELWAQLSFPPLPISLLRTSLERSKAVPVDLDVHLSVQELEKVVAILMDHITCIRRLSLRFVKPDDFFIMYSHPFWLLFRKRLPLLKSLVISGHACTMAIPENLTFQMPQLMRLDVIPTLMHKPHPELRHVKSLLAHLPLAHTVVPGGARNLTEHTRTLTNLSSTFNSLERLSLNNLLHSDVLLTKRWLERLSKLRRLTISPLDDVDVRDLLPPNHDAFEDIHVWDHTDTDEAITHLMAPVEPCLCMALRSRNGGNQGTGRGPARALHIAVHGPHPSSPRILHASRHPEAISASGAVVASLEGRSVTDAQEPDTTVVSQAKSTPLRARAVSSMTPQYNVKDWLAPDPRLHPDRFTSLTVLAMSEHVITAFALALPVKLPELRIMIMLLERQSSPHSDTFQNPFAGGSRRRNQTDDIPHLFTTDGRYQLDNFPVLKAPRLEHLILRPASYDTGAPPVALEKLYDFVTINLRVYRDQLRHVTLSRLRTEETADKAAWVAKLHAVVTAFEVTDKLWVIENGLNQLKVCG